MPSLVQLTDQFSQKRYCGNSIKKCGTNAEIQCSANRSITYARVEQINHSRIGDTILDMSHHTTQNGRLHLTLNGSTASLHINNVKHSDAGTYQFYLRSENDSGFLYSADLKIEGPSEIPQISVKWMDMKIVCQVTGGCPAGTIQWADGSGTNWTRSASSEEKNGVLTSTLLLQKSSIMAEYYCTVTYWYQDKTESETCFISKEEESQCKGQNSLKSEHPGDSEKPNNALYFLVAVPVLICALLALRIYCRRRFVHQGSRVPGMACSDVEGDLVSPRLSGTVFPKIKKKEKQGTGSRVPGMACSDVEGDLVSPRLSGTVFPKIKKKEKQGTGSRVPGMACSDVEGDLVSPRLSGTGFPKIKKKEKQGTASVVSEQTPSLAPLGRNDIEMAIEVQH
ncbi:hypothetical protein NDU88_008735 [Pleurodeles waltl]|uniref:Ig-like domain-containing protein n=2 Tax=Pleurodeles waltl TaxID=8319 RepID=A0AAV7PSZ3_PLEWA|nr:hypothetical protein NDU88_008735 [Pleurodeles waltl]